MDGGIPTELDFLVICRCCLLKLDDGRKLRPLFGSAIDAMLREVTNVSVVQGDGLPEQLCVQCVLQISRAFSLRQQCEKADNILRAYLSTKAQGVDEQQQEQQIGQPAEAYQTIENVIEFDQEDDGERASSSFAFPDDDGQVVALQHQETESLSFPGGDMVVIEESGGGGGSAIMDEINKDIYEEVLGELLPLQQSNSDTINLPSESLPTSPTSLEESPCGQCCMSYATRSALTNHMSMAHKPPLESFQSECDVCGKAFGSQKAIRRHMKTHLLTKPHVCPLCAKSFAESSNLAKHLKSHTGELRRQVAEGPSLECLDCGKRFKWATSLTKHRKYHTGRNLFACSLCDKVYAERKTLQIHLRTHSGDLPFACTVCERRFNQQVNLEKHMRLHSGEKPFSCRLCERQFVQSTHLKDHMVSSHCTQGPPFKCSFCARRFTRKASAVAHARKMHSGEEG